MRLQVGIRASMLPGVRGQETSNKASSSSSRLSINSSKCSKLVRTISRTTSSTSSSSSSNSNLDLSSLVHLVWLPPPVTPASLALHPRCLGRPSSTSNSSSTITSSNSSSNSKHSSHSSSNSSLGQCCSGQATQPQLHRCAHFTKLQAVRRGRCNKFRVRVKGPRGSCLLTSHSNSNNNISSFLPPKDSCRGLRQLQQVLRTGLLEGNLLLEVAPLPSAGSL
mmetsp:Transcript_50547/g.109061  ORF Transcript_50547/g.109061 Transcript_50547/m.109061 type:complete len:222 (+) Transcript_50547:2062-2727(+)